MVAPVSRIMKDPTSHSGLVLCGDWAIAHGNVGGLAVVAKQLAKTLNGPLRDQLVEVARLCKRNEDQATARWYQLRPRLQH
jgi:hypothetical protein